MGINEEPTPRRPRPPPLTALEKLTASPIAVPNPRRMSTGIYDYPDGQKCGMKIFNSVRLAALSATTVSFIDLVFLNVQGSPSSIVSRYLRTVIPAAGAAAVFASTNCIVANYRNKDDQLNHAVSGCLGGAVLLSGTGQVKYGLLGCGFGAFIAAAWKDTIMSGYDLSQGKIIRENGFLGHEDRHIGPVSSIPGSLFGPATEPKDY